MTNLKKLQNLEAQRKNLLEEILGIRRMIPGSYNEVALKCGQKNCWCYSDEKYGHISKRITWNQGGVSRMKTVPENDIPWVQDMTSTYKEYKALRKSLKELDKKISDAMNDIKQDTIISTRKQRLHLWKDSDLVVQSDDE